MSLVPAIPEVLLNLRCERALLAFWIALLIGNGGMLLTLMIANHRTMEEGWL